LPIAGGLAIVVGVGVVGYEHLRLRNSAIAEANERADPDEEPPAA
jgi:hypothetical protein